MAWRCGVLLVAIALWSFRGETAEVVPFVTVDGIRYENVRWGPVNKGRVVIFHSRGNTTVPLDKLPEEYARQLGWTPSQTAPPASPPASPPVPPSHLTAVVPELTIDGVRYESVRWGPVNDGKVVIFHNRGFTTVRLDQLPREYAQQLGWTPPAAPALQPPPAPVAPAVEPVQPPPPPPPVVARIPAQERAAFQQARRAHMVVAGALVKRSQLTELTGFCRSRASVGRGEGEPVVEGWIVELARRKPSDRPVPAEMQNRPGLWETTGVEVFLSGYTPSSTGETDTVVKVTAREGEIIRGYRTFTAAEELTYELWQRLR